MKHEEGELCKDVLHRQKRSRKERDGRIDIFWSTLQGPFLYERAEIKSKKLKVRCNNKHEQQFPIFLTYLRKTYLMPKPYSML